MVFRPLEFLSRRFLGMFAPIALVSLGLPLWTALAGLLTLAALGFGLLVRRHTRG